MSAGLAPSDDRPLHGLRVVPVAPSIEESAVVPPGDGAHPLRQSSMPGLAVLRVAEAATPSSVQSEETHRELARLRTLRPELPESAQSVSPYARVWKPVIEGFAAATLLTVLGPFSKGLQWVAAHDGTGGAGAFRQKRRYRTEGFFWMRKIRTMRTDYEDPHGTDSINADKKQITWFGKIIRPTHFDELPQLGEVLRSSWHTVRAAIGQQERQRCRRAAGKLEHAPLYRAVRSLRVGDRPRQVLALVGWRSMTLDGDQGLAAVDAALLAVGRRVPAGITGLDQITLPSTKLTDEARLTRLLVDAWYADHQSPLLDATICAATPLLMLSGSRLRPGELVIRFWPQAKWRIPVEDLRKAWQKTP